MKDKKISARIGVIMGSQSDWVTMKNSVDIIDSATGMKLVEGTTYAQQLSENLDINFSLTLYSLE